MKKGMVESKEFHVIAFRLHLQPAMLNDQPLFEWPLRSVSTVALSCHSLTSSTIGLAYVQMNLRFFWDILTGEQRKRSERQAETQNQAFKQLFRN